MYYDFVTFFLININWVKLTSFLLICTVISNLSIYFLFHIFMNNLDFQILQIYNYQSYNTLLYYNLHHYIYKHKKHKVFSLCNSPYLNNKVVHVRKGFSTEWWIHYSFHKVDTSAELDPFLRQVQLNGPIFRHHLSPKTYIQFLPIKIHLIFERVNCPWNSWDRAMLLFQ